MMTNEYNSLDNFALWEIEAYLDNEPVAHLAEFLAQNPAAAQEVAQMKIKDATIQQAFYRFDCPEPASLLAYQLEEVDAVEQHKIAAHLQICPLCQTELADMRAFAAEPLALEVSPLTVPESPVESQVTNLLARLGEWIDRVQVVVATLVTPSGPQLAGAAFRRTAGPSSTASPPTTLLFETTDVDISLVVHQRPDNTYRIDGQIFTNLNLAAARFVLTNMDVATSPVTGSIGASGTFIVGRLPAGNYQFLIQLSAHAVLLPSILLESI